MFAEDLRSIDAQLETPVEAGGHAPGKITLHPRMEMGEDGFAQLQRTAGSISKTDGSCVAIELVE